MPRIYFDYNATSPLRACAREAMVEALDAGNASSIHAEGRAARALLEGARKFLARELGAEPDHVAFVSGASEAAATLLRPRGEEFLLVGAGEHACVLSGHGFAAEKTRVIGLDAQGLLDLAALERVLAQVGAAPVLALQAVNNETGAIQPVREAARLVHAAGGFVVCDAVQAVGRIKTSLADFDADALFLSGHKFGGPKGIGAFALKNREKFWPGALIRGGGQERGFRAGTENIAGAVGLRAAFAEAVAAQEAEASRLADLRDFLQAGLLERAPEAVIFSSEAPRVGNTLCFALPGFAAETFLMAFDLEGVALSSGSACSSGKVAPSHVLTAMGTAPELARSSLRVSLGMATYREDCMAFLEILSKLKARMRRRV